MRRLLILVLALCAAGATFFLLELRGVQTTTPQAEDTEAETVYVLVYTRDMPRGTKIETGETRWQKQVRGAVTEDAYIAPADSVALPSDLNGKLLRSDVLAGELVRPSFLTEGSAGFMSLTLAPGMRAVGIAVNAQKLAGGFILPEDRIDLIHTVVADIDGDGKTSGYSQTILENIRVLAVGETPTGRITFQTADQQAATTALPSEVLLKGETITLEMSDAEAAVLFSAMASGQISLALRAMEDHGPSRILSTIGFEDPEKAAAAAEAAKEPAPAAQPAQPAASPAPVTPPPPQTQTVRIFKGGTPTYIEVPRAGTLPSGN
jgi:pilus assembly protein CpaB